MSEPTKPKQRGLIGDKLKRISFHSREQLLKDADFLEQASRILKTMEEKDDSRVRSILRFAESANINSPFELKIPTSGINPRDFGTSRDWFAELTGGLGEERKKTYASETSMDALAYSYGLFRGEKGKERDLETSNHLKERRAQRKQRDLEEREALSLMEATPPLEPDRVNRQTWRRSF